MTNAASNTARRVEAGLARRYSAENRFRLYGIAAIAGAIGFLAVLLGSVAWNGVSAFRQTFVALDITFEDKAIASNDYQSLVKKSLRLMFPEVTSRRDKRRLYKLMSSGAGYDLRDMLVAEPALANRTKTIWLVASDDVDMLIKGKIRRDVPAAERRLNDKEIGWVDRLIADDRVETRFNTRFFTSGDSREPELAGILSALMGSVLSLTVCFLLSFPIGVLTAVYLEEFAPKNRFTELIEININNLAAVPSIVFGLLGLAIFLNVFGLPRSAPLVGGMVLALMTLPTIIIAGRAALKAVPPSIREAALGVGASPLQAVFHHALPLAMPGMLTGTIIGMAQALGETAPLLIIGMVAFVVDVPAGFVEPATALPVQIFLWADSPERAFVERTSAAIIVLLSFLIIMNLTAIVMRRKFERNW